MLRFLESKFVLLRLSLAGGIVLRQNIPVEVHASQVYTRTMFEKFGEALYVCGSYDLVEVKPQLEYIARHIKFQSREKWCKNEFVISLSETANEFRCECGTFENYGMVCSHALKGMSYLLFGILQTIFCVSSPPKTCAVG